MLLFYSTKTTKRLKYICKLIFTNLLGVEYKHTTSEEELINYNGPKINYSQQHFGEEIFIFAHNLLFETGIYDQNIIVSEHSDSKVFFTNYNKQTVLPFDPFAASFYLVARYEEYLPYIKDNYGRFDAQESLAYKNNFLQKPLVNIWSLRILEIIKEKHPELVYKLPSYKFIPTIDIDLAFQFKHKGILRNLGGCVKSISNLNFNDLSHRIRVITNKEKDPYDTFDYQIKLQKEHKYKPIYFILFAEYSQFDKNINTRNRVFCSLIKSIGDYAEIGIHPSFSSNKNISLLSNELKRLSEVLNREITKSRQHFLKLDIPSTYRNLINLGITDDYTMGYASEIGFRASICSTYNFYDLDLETETSLKIHPFSVMEGTLRTAKNIPPTDAIKHIEPLIKEVKAVNGTYISLWHNGSLGEDKAYKGWRQVYEKMITLALYD